MGREIVSISVPVKSEVWHRIKSWQANKETNVSVNVCACIADRGRTVEQLDALRAEWAKLGDLLNRRKHMGLSKEEWEEYFWTGA